MNTSAILIVAIMGQNVVGGGHGKVALQFANITRITNATVRAAVRWITWSGRPEMTRRPLSRRGTSASSAQRADTATTARVLIALGGST